MHQLPYLHSYGEQPMGEGLPSLTIAVTRDGKTGMSGRKLADLFRCDWRELPKLIYGDPVGRNGPELVKSQSGRGQTLSANYRIPPGCKGTGAGLHLFPTELIGPAANQRQQVCVSLRW